MHAGEARHAAHSLQQCSWKHAAHFAPVAGQFGVDVLPSLDEPASPEPLGGDSPVPDELPELLFGAPELLESEGLVQRKAPCACQLAAQASPSSQTSYVTVVPSLHEAMMPSLQAFIAPPLRSAHVTSGPSRFRAEHDDAPITKMRRTGSQGFT